MIKIGNRHAGMEYTNADFRIPVPQSALRDIYAFIGHNGAGKTTTLKCIAGIHDYETGASYSREPSTASYKTSHHCPQLICIYCNKFCFLYQYFHSLKTNSQISHIHFS